MKGHREHARFGLLRAPLFLGPRMRTVYRNFTFCMFFVCSCSSSKLKGHREHAGFGLLRDPLFLGRPKEKKKEKEEKEEKKKQKQKKKKKKEEEEEA